ncbi:unnamed protein product, partial [marine sediment metagenome]
MSISSHSNLKLYSKAFLLFHLAWSFFFQSAVLDQIEKRFSKLFDTDEDKLDWRRRFLQRVLYRYGNDTVIIHNITVTHAPTGKVFAAAFLTTKQMMEELGISKEDGMMS